MNGVFCWAVVVMVCGYLIMNVIVIGAFLWALREPKPPKKRPPPPFIRRALERREDLRVREKPRRNP